MKKKTSFPKEKINILLLEGVHPAAIELFREHGYTKIESLTGSPDPKILREKIAESHLLGIRSKTQINANILKAGNRLLGIGAFCIGTNQIDMAAATDYGVAVFNSPFSNTRSVAELVIAHCINLLRRVVEKNEAAHQGKWLKESSSSYEVRGKTLGIIGYGHIGSQVSVLAENMGMKVLFYDIEPKLSLGNASPVKSLEELLKRSDIITLHVPGTPLTKNMINESRIAKMKNASYLINLSRGEVVDIPAVRKSLESGHLAGFAADVFPVEPQSNKDVFKSPVQKLSNVILTPHIGGSTVEAQENIGIDVASKLISFLETGATTGSLSVPALSLPVQLDAHRLLHIHKNVPGVLGEINSKLSHLNVNILGQYLKTNNQIGYVVLDVDKKTSAKALDELKQVKHTIRVRELY